MSKDAGRDTLGYGPAANGRRNGDQMTDFEMGTSMRGVAVEEPLSEEELDQLSDFLKEIGPSALNLEGVDGLFCALISGPEMVPNAIVGHLPCAGAPCGLFSTAAMAGSQSPHNIAGKQLFSPGRCAAIPRETK
jgi:hypothetical protein